MTDAGRARNEPAKGSGLAVGAPERIGVDCGNPAQGCKREGGCSPFCLFSAIALDSPPLAVAALGAYLEGDTGSR